MSQRRSKELREYKKVLLQKAQEGIVACKECGSRNAIDPAHLVPRSRSKALITEPRNIIWLCRSHHHQLDQGDRYSLRIWPWIVDRCLELDPQYGELLKMKGPQE